MPHSQSFDPPSFVDLLRPTPPLSSSSRPCFRFTGGISSPPWTFQGRFSTPDTSGHASHFLENDRFFFLSFFGGERRGANRTTIELHWTVDGMVEGICWKMISGDRKDKKEGLEATIVEKLRRNGKIRLCVNYTEFFP